MTRQVFPPLQIEKDVMLGVLPLYHIFGRTTGEPLPRRDAENANYRCIGVDFVIDSYRVANRNHATIRSRSILSKHRKV